MPINNVLNEVINQRTIQQPKLSGKKTWFEITELDTGSLFKPIDLYFMSKHTLLFKYDNLECSQYKYKCCNKSLHFNHMCKGINKGCDYVLYSYIEDKHYFFFIECKSDSVYNKDIRDKLKNGNIFIDYLISLTNYYFNTSITNYEVINVLFKTDKQSRLNEIKDNFKKNKEGSFEFLQKNNYKKDTSNKLCLTIDQLINEWNKL